MAALPPRPARLLKSFAMPVDPARFAGVPSVTCLKLLPKANVLLAAAMDRRVVSCDLAADVPKGPPPNRVPAKHLAWSHDNWVHALDVHSDGARVATGGADRRIKIWKWGQDKPLADFKAHDDCVRAVAFSPNGRLLASAGDDGQVRLWDIETDRAGLILVLKAQAALTFFDTVAWSMDGKYLLISGNDGKIDTLDVERKQLTPRSTDVDNRRNIEDEPLNGGFSYPGGIRRLTVSPDGKLFAAVGLTSLLVAEMATGKPVLQLAGRGFGVAFDPSSRWLAFSREKALLVWDFQAGALSHQVPVDQLGLFGVVFLKGGQHLASGGCNGWVGLWDLTS